MKFEVSAQLTYNVLSPSTLILNIQPFKTYGQFVLEENFQCNSHVKTYEWISPVGEKRFKVIEILKEEKLTFTYNSRIETQIKTINAAQLDDVPISLMPVAVLPYLNPSRYCQSDQLYKFAADKFGHIENTYDKVIAVRDWIYEHVEYNGAHTTPQTSAFDTVTELIGVCRDFAHLGVAICRALTIPARYFTCYAYQLHPQDFHACFEVYLGGHWVVMDATKLVPINGLVKIATGFDAADTAVASSFGNLSFQSMDVKVKTLDGNFEAVDADSLTQGYSYH
ncbi:MAG: transglutaminase family protein [Pedobacter sp.]|nr:MAG: transglutaminase family protein [Pedobacter sp.]